MKKKNRRLHLNRETLNQLHETRLQQAAGGLPRCGSDECTASCQLPNFSNCAQTRCICPDTQYF